MNENWLINVYLAGDNNLTGDMVRALQGMRDTATSEVQISAQFDPLGAEPRIYFFPETPPVNQEPLGLFGYPLVEYLESQASDVWEKLEQELETEAAIDAAISVGSAIKGPLGASMAVFYRRRAPATYRMVVLSGHGNGAIGEFLKDTSSNSSINVITLCDIIAGATKYCHILGMDSCLMSMAEVCYQASLTKKVGILVASEGFLVNTGWPYERILEGIVGLNSRSPKDVAKTIVKEHIRYYADYAFAGISADCSAIKLTEFAPDAATNDFVATDRVFEDVFIPPFSHLAALLRSKCNAACGAHEAFRIIIQMAHSRAQCYNDDQYVDVWDFCQQFDDYYRKGFNLRSDEVDDVTRAIAAVKQAVKDVVLRSCYAGSAFQYSHGLSVYFPRALVDYVKAYDDLEFPKETGWNLFLKEFLRGTQRTPRPGEPPEQLCKPVDPGMLTIRMSPPWTKGAFCSKAGGTRNYPHKFFASTDCCNDPADEGGDE